jgi:alpha-mannosidase
VRVWEQSGLSGEVDLTLPNGFKASTAQPVSLRGEKTGKPIEIRQGTLKFNLKAYAPASFVLN